MDILYSLYYKDIIFNERTKVKKKTILYFTNCQIVK